jgi:hypothetical protein
MPCRNCNDPDGDGEQFRGVRAQWDVSQIALHYSVPFSLLAAVVLAIWWWLH